jgi:hypothetical protein
MTFLRGAPTYKNELRECYRLTKKVVDLCKTRKNSRRRTSLLQRQLGGLYVIDEFLDQLHDFFHCRLDEIGALSSSHAKLVTEICSECQKLRAAVRYVRHSNSRLKQAARILSRITELKRQNGMKVPFRLDCVTTHRSKVELTAVMLWGDQI